MELSAIVFLTIILGIPFLVYAVSGSRVLPATHKIKLALIAFFVLYAFIVVSAEVQDWLIQEELYKYDLDGNKSFSQEELTPEAEVAMENFTNDTGRTFAPITGFIFSFLYVSLFFLMAKLIETLVGKHVPRNT